MIISRSQWPSGLRRGSAADRLLGLRVKYPLFLSHFNKIWISWIYFETYSNTKIHANPYSGSRVVPCGQTDSYDGTNIDFFAILAKAPKIRWLQLPCICMDEICENNVKPATTVTARIKMHI
jgi:hypothetical protein